MYLDRCAGALGDGGNGQLHLAGGSLDGDRVALLLAEEGAADRGLVADAALRGVRLGRADELVLLALAVGALHRHGRADLDLLRLCRRALVDDRDVLELAL